MKLSTANAFAVCAGARQLPRVMPESTAVYRERVLREYPESAFAYVLRGEDPAHLKAYERTDVLLSRAWKAAVDSMRVRRQAATPTAASPPPP